MRRQPYKNLRYSQKVRELECFIEADGLQKKIRKFNAGKASGSIDAEMKMREIECFWKEGWKYNHTHHIYLEPKVTHPQFYLPTSRETHPKLERYYELLHQYLVRLRVDNQDETNFKIDQRFFTPASQAGKMQKSEMQVELEGMIEFDESIDESKIVNLAFDHLTRVFGQVSDEMIANFNKSLELSQHDMMNECLEEEQIQHLKHISSACSNCSVEEEGEARQHTEQFMRLFMEVVSEAKANKHYSAVISTQPEMGELSAILHPFCWGLYSTFSKELLVKEAKRKRGRRYADEQDEPLTLSGTLLRERLNGRELLAIQDDFKQEEERHSRVVFINLDGFESQFTLEFLRNFADNVMHISFPKFETGVSEKHYNHRFHKKIMYNFTRSELDILGCCEEEGLDAMSLTIEREDLLGNPQKYHETIDQLYTTTQVSGRPEDFNRNIFIFPIGLNPLQAEQDISANDKNIDGYESHLIRFILRDHLYSAMKAFKPQAVFLSYTGKIRIQNQHFLEMLQELVKICPKIIFFPNYTSVFANNGLARTNQNIGRGIIPKDDESNLQQRIHDYYDRESYNPWEVQLMDKLSIFLKVTAGYYNLILPFEEEDLSSKYKNSRVFRFIIYLYSALKNQYEHCKRRVESSTLETARASLEANIKEYSKEINRCIPSYYERLFQFITELLRGSLQDNQYSLTAEDVRDKFPATFEEDEPYLRHWMELRRAEELMLASAKYHEISQLQLRQKASREEYVALKDERMNSLDCLYRISFYYKQESNQIVKLYKDTTLLWRQNQHLSSKNHFYVVLANLFTPSEQDIQHYISKPKLSSKKIQRCQIIPITFHTRNGIIPRDNIFKVWTDWNYAETARNVILYWPTDFDFINYYLSKLLQRNYEPTVLRRLFAAKKTSQSLNKHDSAFYEINIGDNIEVAPRWGCSSFNIEDQLYILGGSYDSEHSYLNLQNDVTTIDLTDNNPQDFSPAKLRNINKELYANEAFWGKLRQGRTVNSFVRPRQQFEFYGREELLIDEQPQQAEKENDVRKIYMIGGYGEQFKTPYSLFVNYFYEIAIERATRRLLSIKKIVVPDKVVPINVRAMIKNRGIYQKANILESSEAGEEQQKCKEGMTSNRHYFHHQVIYAIKNDQLHYKIKNLFAIELYENSKKDFYNFARRMGEAKNAQQPETILIRKVEGSRHQVLVQIGDIYYLYSLNLQLRGQEIEEIPLMNESIIALDTKKLTIFALISHSKHTHSKCILASEAVRLHSQTITGKQKHYALVLKEIMTFEQSLNLHTLIICNVNEVSLLHGISFQNCRNKQYLIKVKSKGDIKKEEINMVSVSPLQFSAIISFFSKKNNIINSINFLQTSEANYYFEIHRLTLDINRFSQGWKPNGHINKMCFVHRNTILQKINFEARIDSFADVNSIVILIYTSKKAYHIKLYEINNDKAEVEVQELTDRLTIQKYKCMECLVKIVKNQELYDDFNYFQ